MGVPDKGVLLNVPKEVSLGKIEAGRLSEQKRFPIHVQRSVSPGELPVHFTISEQNFGTKNITLALNVVKERAEVITVKGQERPKQSVDIAIYNFPPTIAIATPYDNEKVASEAVVLKGIASDDKGIAQIEIRVNGRNMEGRGIKVSPRVIADPREREILENVSLRPGKNIIMVTAYDNEHLSTSKTITVYRESEKGAIWAAVIGINKYKDPKLSLKYARNDAEAFATYLRSNMGMESDHIFQLYDEKATLRNIKSVLGTQLRQRANKPEDSIFVFFAGHGAPEQSASARDEDKVRKYILPHDSEVEDLYATALQMDEIGNLFGDISAQRIIFIIDSCYSGAGGGRTILAPRGRAILSEDFLSRLSQGKGRIILTSSKPGELSEESDELKHGYFTFCLLEGLKGKADINGDGIIDIDEISLYLNKTVPEKTSGKQHPVKKGEAEGQVVVGRVK